MEITDLSKLSSPTAASAPTASNLGQEDFLRMLIAQLQNQDPLNPQDPSQFSAQLAQFSSLEQQVAMRTSLDQISGVLSSGDKSTAIDLIGRDVVAETPQFELAGRQATLRYDLAGASDTTVVEIRDATGGLVQTADLGPRSGGLGEFIWDGMGRSGNPVPDGIYSFAVKATADLRPVNTTEMVEGRVSGADVSGRNPVLRIGQLVIPLSAIQEVRNSPTSSGARL